MDTHNLKDFHHYKGDDLTSAEKVERKVIETFLNVTRQGLINKVKECWESINSERAQDYASGQNLSEDQMKVAVVVQKMVDAQAAGVMFTVNPVTKDENEVMVESVLGTHSIS